jgi:predicted ester cyclase
MGDPPHVADVPTRHAALTSPIPITTEGTMSNENILRAVIDAIDAHRYDEVPQLVTADFEMRSPDGTFIGPEQMTAMSRGYHEAFPDGVHTLERVVEVGDTIVSEGYWSGTNTGPLQTPAGTIPATGGTGRISFGGIATVRGGQLATMHVYFDRLEFLVQLGLLPEPAVAG